MQTPDPNKKMEDLLRACARKRREQAGAPFELAPHIRARLQQEVRRELDRSAAAPPPRWALPLGGWLRLALGGAAVALVVLMVWNFAPKRDTSRQLAKAETWASNILPAPAPATPAAPAAPSSLVTLAPTPMTAPPAAALARPPAAGTADGFARRAEFSATTTNDALALETRAPASGPVGGVAMNDRPVPATPPATPLPFRTDGMSNTVGGTFASVAAGAGGDSGDRLDIGGNRGGGSGFGGGAGGGARSGRGGGRGGRTAMAGPIQPPQPAANISALPSPTGVAGASLALQPTPAPAAPAASMVAAETMPGSAIRSPQFAVRNSQIAPPSLQSASVFAQQMARSEQLPVQNAPQYRGAAVASPPFEVLSSFQIERTGRQVRIVDADGSAYEGQVVEPELLASLQNASQAAGNAAATSGAATAAQDKDAGQTRGNPNAQAKAVELPSNAANNDAALNQAISPGANALSNLAVLQQADAGSGFAFQVNGLNRKLNQNVSIIGNCVTVPFQADASLNVGNQSVQSQTQAQANGNANGNMSNLQTQQQRLPAGQAQNLLANSNGNFQNTQAVQNAAFAGQFWRVTGRVQIGATNQFDLDAAAVLP